MISKLLWLNYARSSTGSATRPTGTPVSSQSLKVDAEKLDKIYDYDQALLNGIGSLSAALESLETIEDPEQLKDLIKDLKKQAQDIVTKADQRKDVITHEDEIISDGEIIEGEFVSDDEIPNE